MNFINRIFKKKNIVPFSNRKEIGTLAYPDRPYSKQLSVDGMYFKVINGLGGIAIEVQEFDEKTDRNTQVVYIIPDNKDLATELAHIITMSIIR